MAWKLARTRQCAKCPWRTDVDPRDIANGYSEERHRALARTIAKPADFTSLDAPLHMMACHETEKAHCIGWLANQVGPGNNIPLRMRLRDCENAHRIQTVGEQHLTFDDTLPKDTPK
ncbi:MULTISPECIES: DUF6283 family protein [unclassified Variovorax]|uniref:DUF6283 family protein n=1 Tax=unclassified Variovorax TaxID=663243 RepID=UPI0013175472|nr:MULTISPECIES: DUF6283 family protein [unclassified Variovorax]VTU43054.1 hypothetical protein SRS16P1_00425 [Variovorax sp. SRS16]VTU43082.1 hypothetical protein E5P1_00422 [Variovorax sp. PBL-E5]VTU43486.1 hypothetical protein H6P1_00481 [Variovorax sp. PBL-H6]